MPQKEERTNIRRGGSIGEENQEKAVRKEPCEVIAIALFLLSMVLIRFSLRKSTGYSMIRMDYLYTLH